MEKRYYQFVKKIEWIKNLNKVIPNTWNNADRLCEILKCTKEQLPARVPMEQE